MTKRACRASAMRHGAAHGGIQLGLALSAILASALLGSADGFAGGWGPGGLSSARLHPPRMPRPTLANVAMLANKERKRRLPFDGLPFTLFKGDQVATESLSSSAETLSLSVSDQKKEVIEACLEQYNAVYTILWEKEGDGPFRVKGAYTTEARRRYEGCLPPLRVAATGALYRLGLADMVVCIAERCARCAATTRRLRQSLRKSYAPPPLRALPVVAAPRR